MVGESSSRPRAEARGWALCLALALSAAPVCAQTQPAARTAAAGTTAAAERRLDILEFKVTGSRVLKPIEVEEAVYPFLGPQRSLDDVEKARAALEEVYNAKGYQTVSVQIPPQQGTGGIITLAVVEGEVGRLRVRGSRYFSLDAIKEQAPSLAEGTVPNFNDISRDIVALNQLPDRRVTPTLRAGTKPGTIDVDLNVEDKLPLHGSLELNNRYSANTKPLRLTGTLRYDNLWQLGHSLSTSFQVAPERPDDAKVFSASYMARVPDVTWLSFLLYGMKQDSDVSTLGGINVAGRGEVVGLRAIFTLPSEAEFFHSVSAGIDYKHFDEGVTLGGGTLTTPITYYPFTATYTAMWSDDGAQTQLNAGTTFHLRGMGSDGKEFDNKRTFANENFIYVRGDLSHTRELPEGLQIHGKLGGQVADQALVSNEQFSVGGAETVRGYLESEALGDNGAFASIELRSPSVVSWFASEDVTRLVEEWRFHVFAEAGIAEVIDALAEQESSFHLASIGVGTRVRLMEHLHGALDVALPFIDQSSTQAYDPRVHFRLWAEY